MVQSCPPECFRLLLYHLSLYTSKPIHKNNRDCLFGQWTSSPPLELRRCWKNLVSETKSFTYRDTQWFNSNIWSYISGKRFTVCNLFKSLNFDELVFSYSQEKSDFRAHFDFTAINIKVRISVVPLQCPCLHIRGGFFLLLPSGFLAENICWILGPQSPTPLGYQHSCYMYFFVLGSLAMRGTLTLIKFPAARTRVNVMIGKWRRWNSHLGQIGKGETTVGWRPKEAGVTLHCIALLFRTSGKVKSSWQGLQNLVSKTIFKDGCLNPIKEVLWLLFRCIALHRHLSKRKDTICCWRLFLSETCIGFTMHNVTAPALHVKCLSCTISRSALGASLCIDVFLLQKSTSAKQYLTASLWVSTKNYVRIW